MNKEKLARKNLLRISKEAKGVPVRGYNFNNGVDYPEILKSFATTGFQASHFSQAMTITNEMIKDKSTIFLGYTSNMVSSGLRDVFRYLVQEKKVHVIVTTAGGIEEDLIKCLGDFAIGDFRASGAALRKEGINRIGNIYAPNNRYVAFESWVQPILEEAYNESKQRGKPFTASELIWKLGEKIDNPESICYWAWKNRIPIYCPALGDGALGDNIYFFSFKRSDVEDPRKPWPLGRRILEHPKHERLLPNHGFQAVVTHRALDFTIDLVKDITSLNNMTIGLKKSGVIILGSGVIKHAILNANMLRNGADYAVYINTAQEFDGSDAGALPDEAVSWGKILPGAKSVKVFADATIVFPLLVAETFARNT